MMTMETSIINHENLGIIPHCFSALTRRPRMSQVRRSKAPKRLEASAARNSDCCSWDGMAKKTDSRPVGSWRSSWIKFWFTFSKLPFFGDLPKLKPKQKVAFFGLETIRLRLRQSFWAIPFLAKWPQYMGEKGTKSPKLPMPFFWLNRHVLRPDFHVEIRPHLNRDNWRIWHKAWNSYIYIYIAKFNPSFQQSPSFNVPNLLHDFLLLLTRIVLHPSLLRSSTVESNLSLGNIRQPLNLAINLQPK